MGFNSITLLSFVFGLLVPLGVLVFFFLSPRKKEITFDSIAYGFVSFLGSIIAAFIIFTFASMLFMNNITFDSEDASSGLGFAGTVISVMVAILFVLNESLRMFTLNKFRNSERHLYSGIGFAAGTIIAQSCAVFVAINIFDGYEMDAPYALFSGGIICVTGIMYLLLSYSSEIAFEISGKGAAYGLMSVYYIFWIAIVIFSSSTIMLYVAGGVVFLVAVALSAVFVVRRSRGEKA